MSGRSIQPILELFAVFALVFLAQLVTALAGVVGGLFVLAPPLTDQPWAAVTSVYAHANLGHLLSNSVALLVFGWPIARATTRLRFHLFFLLSGTTAGVSQILLSRVLAETPLIGVVPTPGVLGASGAVFALLGYLLASNRLSSGIGSRLQLSRSVIFVGFLAIATVLTLATASPGVALIAHFVGLLLGLVAGRYSILAVGVRSSKVTKV